MPTLAEVRVAVVRIADAWATTVEAVRRDPLAPDLPARIQGDPRQMSAGDFATWCAWIARHPRQVGVPASWPNRPNWCAEEIGLQFCEAVWSKPYHPASTEARRWGRLGVKILKHLRLPLPDLNRRESTQLLDDAAREARFARAEGRWLWWTDHPLTWLVRDAWPGRDGWIPPSRKVAEWFLRHREWPGWGAEIGYRVDRDPTRAGALPGRDFLHEVTDADVLSVRDAPAEVIRRIIQRKARWNDLYDRYDGLGHRAREARARYAQYRERAGGPDAELSSAEAARARRQREAGCRRVEAAVAATPGARVVPAAGLAAEGARMDHCAAAYELRVRERECVIVALPGSTAEISWSGALVQHRAYRNSAPSAHDEQIVDALMARIQGGEK